MGLVKLHCLVRYTCSPSYYSRLRLVSLLAWFKLPRIQIQHPIVTQLSIYSNGNGRISLSNVNDFSDHTATRVFKYEDFTILAPELICTVFTRFLHPTNTLWSMVALGGNDINQSVTDWPLEVVLKPNSLTWSIDVTMPVFGKKTLAMERSDSFSFSHDRIYVDAVINHMAAGGNQGSAGEWTETFFRIESTQRSWNLIRWFIQSGIEELSERSFWPRW